VLIEGVRNSPIKIVVIQVPGWLRKHI
jgi:hypothetical protein